ncbi:kinase [Lithospermum erythrorhizon]|uniref:Inositol-pentakisphosphate 2-kinase n=1 Tax=Lithospermum erythrorhizon TaxID=34254 RepID=A0AAV3RUX6_LITER
MMTVVLQAEDDASEWSYRGEGAVNLVLSYSGNSQDFIGKVLRIPKVPRNDSDHENGHSGLNTLECILWRDSQDLVLAPTREVAEQLYVKHVMCPLLGPEHVDAGVPVYASREFLEAVERNVLCQRPSWRVDAAKVNALNDFVILMSDHSVFPRRIIKEALSISVELKPKCGFLPTSEFIAKGNAIKRSVTRFRMHQALKLLQGKISQKSEYNPLDLFSGSKNRVQKAINNLFITPQNNFRVFLNGSLIFGGLGGGAEKTNFVVGEAFEEALKHVIMVEDGMHTKYFLELVADAVFKSELLNQLLEVQKLDTVDIEGAIHAYYNIIGQPCAVCRDRNESELSKRCSMLHSLPLDESLKIVRDYLISATAKDLSMIISFRPREKGDPESPYEVVFLKPTAQSFDFKASFIDLDMKPLEKMEYYYKLDQQIVRCYAQTLKEDHFEDVATIKGISH